MSEKTEIIEQAKAGVGKVGAGGLSLAGVLVLVVMQLLQSLSGADAARDAKLDRVYEIANTTAAQVQVIDARVTSQGHATDVRMTALEKGLEKLSDKVDGVRK